MTLKGEWQGIVFSLSIQSFGLHFEHSEGKKTHGMVIKWFHLVGTVIESDKEPCKLIIHHARRQTFGSAGFQDSDPIPEDTADAKRLSILKYPKLAFDQITVTFTEDKMAKKVHKLIAKSLRALGQGTPLSASPQSSYHTSTLHLHYYLIKRISPDKGCISFRTSKI